MPLPDDDEKYGSVDILTFSKIAALVGLGFLTFSGNNNFFSISFSVGIRTVPIISNVSVGLLDVNRMEIFCWRELVQTLCNPFLSTSKTLFPLKSDGAWHTGETLFS